MLYKYPMMISVVGCVFYKRKLVQAHANLFKKSFYLRLETPQKKLHNGLQFALMMLYLANLATCLIAFLFSSSQYFYGVNNRYFNKMGYERDLQRKYIREIKAYSRIINSN